MTALVLGPCSGGLLGPGVRSAGPEGFRVTSITTDAIKSLKAGLRAASSQVFNDLEALAQECGMNLHNCEVFALAQRFLLLLPSNVPAPELALDADGEVVFDWTGPNRRMLTVTLREDGRLSYAARLSALDKEYGTKPFADLVPQQVLDLVRQVTQP